MRPTYELADIICQSVSRFISGRAVLPYHQKVLWAIEKCRTAALGGHVERCTDCGTERVSYNSCRNRHCPKCQGSNRDKWIQARQDDLLDCRYFHVVFTLPECLNSFCLHYPRELYNLLFFSVKQTLQTFGQDEKYLGADVGAVAVLHTWGQTLMLHPHIHLIVPAGGIDKNGHWKHTRTGGKYLFPVKAMSAVYRGKFMTGFKVFLEENGMELTDELRNAVYRKEWVVYAKRPFGGAAQVIEYLGRYTHKIAISNHRLTGIDHGKVSFTYKDYSDTGKTKIMTLDSVEFLRRFCLHILPRGFRKIRHWGILSSRNKPKLKAQQQKMNPAQTEKQRLVYKKAENFCTEIKQCPCCKTGRMEIVMSFQPNAPPLRQPKLPIASPISKH
jgi:hypothetical protein